MSVSVCLMEVHWRIIANLRFKFRSNFNAQLWSRGVVIATTSRAMLATARPSCTELWFRVRFRQFSSRQICTSADPHIRILPVATRTYTPANELRKLEMDGRNLAERIAHSAP